MSTIDVVVSRLSSADLEAAAQLRDVLENYVTGPMYPAFTKRLMPLFISLLKGSPVFETSEEQRLRNTVLEILHRLPSSPPEVLEPYAAELVDLLLNILRTDNEDNAHTAIKIIMDLMRSQTQILGDKVQPLLDLIQEVFAGMDAVVRDQLDNAAPAPPPPPPSSTFAGPAGSTPSSSHPQHGSPRPGSPPGPHAAELGGEAKEAAAKDKPRALQAGMKSFKVVIEFPIIVVSIFQCYRSCLATNVQLFIPLVQQLLLLQARPQAEAHAEAARRQTVFTGISPRIRQRAAFGDFITAQVKTMSFLAYLLRAHAPQLSDFVPKLPDIVVRLLKDLPQDRSATRKELLVATRHIINFNFRRIFVDRIVDLLDERVLLGDGPTVHETLRPLAYSMLADLIHHVREFLGPAQIRRTIDVYTRTLLDDYPGCSFQTMSAKLLLNLAEVIAKMPDKLDARHYLMLILNAMANKFAAMNHEYPNAVKRSRETAGLPPRPAAAPAAATSAPLMSAAPTSAAPSDPSAPTSAAPSDPSAALTSAAPDWDAIDIFSAAPITSVTARERADPVADNKFLFKVLITGLKNTVYQLKSCNRASAVDPPNEPAHWADVSHGFSAEEVHVLTKLFREGAAVFRYYDIDAPPAESPFASPVEFLANHYMVSSSREEKDLLETFATVFHCIDAATFLEVFAAEIPHLYTLIFAHTALLHVPQFFLASDATSPSFCGLLLRFCMARLEDVGAADVKTSSILLRLFKLAFMAVTLFAGHNEQVLLPHVATIVTRSLELATTAAEPINYFLLLRALFRSIGGGKFELLYKQLLPLLEMLLDVLNGLLRAARRPADRELFVELCLTVPARLSNLLPHLSYLMRPLVIALRQPSDLIGQGLRTLELCVDNLTADYLDPIMAPVMDELMTALFDHLRPAPYSHFHAHSTLRILGKLGGRNRQCMATPPPLAYEPHADDATSYDLRLVGTKKERALRADVGLARALATMAEVPKGAAAKRADPHYKRQALHFIKAQIRLRIGGDSLPDDLVRLVRLQAQDLVARISPHDLATLERADRDRSIAKKEQQDVTMQRLVTTLLATAARPDLAAEADALVRQICRHVALLELGKSLLEMKQANAAFDMRAGAGRLCIETTFLAAAVGEALASDHVLVREAAAGAVREVYEAATILLGGTEHVHRLSFFAHLGARFVHHCYEDEWFTKAGGCAGIRLLLDDLDLAPVWLQERQIALMEALLYIIRDTPADLCAKTRTDAHETLDVLLRRCCRHFDRAELRAPAPPADGEARVALPKPFRMCKILAKELAHCNPAIRSAAQRAIGILATELAVAPWELLEPHRDEALEIIYSKPLRALPFAPQIGLIEAATYYLRLRADFVPVDDKLNRLLMEALALADAPDETLAQKPAEQRTHRHIIDLRVACVTLLSIALDDFSQAPLMHLKSRVITVFFKCLSSESVATADAAHAALRRAIAHLNKLPKDLLQLGLRPILHSIQEPRRLSCQSLDTLARLLQLMMGYFRVEIGTRLLDHAAVLAERNLLQKLSFTMIEQNEHIKVLAAVYHVFHLLPPAADQYLERIVDQVLDVEAELRRTCGSPFRPPLHKYLNRFPDAVWALFLARLDQLRYGRLLAQVLLDVESRPLREGALRNLDALVAAAGIPAPRDLASAPLDPLNPNAGIVAAPSRPASGDAPQQSATAPQPRFAAIINAIHLVHAVSGFDDCGAWMDKPNVRHWLMGAGQLLEDRLRNRELPPPLRLAAEQAGEQLMVILTRYMAVHPNDLDFLFNLIQAVTQEHRNHHTRLQNTPALIKHLYTHLISSESVDLRRAVILRSLDVYAQRDAAQQTKAFLLHYLVNPILAMDAMRCARAATGATTMLVDKAIIDTIYTKIWIVPVSETSDESAAPAGIDHTRLEVLQLTAMLVKYHHVLVKSAQKQIIKLGWQYIRFDDVIIKHAAYVLIAYFIALYETPARICTQVYVAILRLSITEGRALVAQALDLLAAVLPKRCRADKPEQQAIDLRNPIWAMGPRRVLAEEGQNVQQLTSILHFLVKHPNLFYDARDKFVNVIITSLRRIAQPPNESKESKRLALSLMQLIWQWERRRVDGVEPAETPARVTSESPTSRKRKVEDTPMEGVVAVGERSEYLIPDASRLKMIKYLVEFIAGLSDRYPLPSARPMETITTTHGPMAPSPPDLIKKALNLLNNLLQPRYWGDLDVDLFPNVTEVVLASERTTAALATNDKDKPDEKFLTCIIHALQVVRIIVNSKSDEWVLKNMTTIQHLLEKCLKTDHAEIQDSLNYGDDVFDDGRKLKALLQRLLDAVPEDVPMDDADADGEPETPVSEIITSTSTTAAESLGAGHYMAGINLLWTLSRRKPAEVDAHISLVMKALQTKLARDHLAYFAHSPGGGSAAMAGQGTTGNAETPQMSPHEFEVQTALMLKAIDVIALRMEVLGDHRRPFLSMLATLVEKSMSNTLCLKILEMVEHWIFTSEGSWPTLKEKTAVLHKMLTFETRSDPTMLTKFLQLVIRIYEDPKITHTELTVRMEHAFLIGTRAQDVDMRNRFLAILDRSQSKTASLRLNYVILGQNWDTLAESYWLAQASHLLLGAVDGNAAAQLHREDFRTMPLSEYLEPYARDARTPVGSPDARLDALMQSHRRFMSELADVKVRDLIDPLSQLQHVDPNMAHELWVALFPMYWSATPKEDRMDLERGMVALLTKDFHARQMDKRPNVIQSLLEGAVKAGPDFKIPPHVLKFEARTYDAWYTALVQLEQSAIAPDGDSALVRESNLDALGELYAGLQEDDLFYGGWRRRCRFNESNAALSYEQSGLWDKAQAMYEQAQIKARTGAIPFSQGEYMLWEDHWVTCAQKLQQWEILQDFAKHENFQDLLLECAWRNVDMWQAPESREQLDHLIQGVMDAPTPRRTFFQAFMSLLKLHHKQETPAEFQKVCDEATQLSIRKWHQLPGRITQAHVPMLQNFQQLVELHDASVICQSLAQTTSLNLDSKSAELKLLLGTWRDRLPNIWDDIIAWQDLVTWRQHIFHLINNTYLHLLPTPAPNVTGASSAYRGYHEIAWIINRFAHVARKHQLPEVCISQLSRIYTLPNIEIQEAFLKLREQAKCHYQNPNELNNGLDVINNTNLNYFGPNQKAEFYTLKGMFLEKLGRREDADDAYGMALFFDIKLPKAWAEWGYYNDRLFKEKPTEMTFALQALSCYLEAAGVYKSAKSRKLLMRVLWLLSMDDAEGTLGAQFDAYKGDTPVWYWITYIPQLLTGLGHKEAPKAHAILAKIAKSYPQALYFQLRTNREDMLTIKKSQEAKGEKERRMKAAQGATSSPAASRSDAPGGSAAAGGAQSTPAKPNVNGSVDVKMEGAEATNGTTPAKDESVKDQQLNGSAAPAKTNERKPPWEHTEEIMAVLKTAFPLLALSMESMVDQIAKHFKCPPDEDAYRLIVALLNDGLSYVSRMPTSYNQDVKLPQATESNITRFAETIVPPHIRATFEADFVKKRPTMYEYIHKLRKWRDKFEEKLDRRNKVAYLETYSQVLSEFRFTKFDEVEVPGQYLQHKDKNQDFIRIDRFMPDVDLVRGIGINHRRLKIRGHDGSVHPFAVQHPAARHCRREERILQLFRHFNCTLGKRKESRRRNLAFHLPLMIPLAPHIRMVQDDASYISLQQVYEDHCRKGGWSKDEPVLFAMDCMKNMPDAKKFPDQASTTRLEIFSAIQEKWVPNTILLDHVTAIYPSFADFWLFRKQASYSLAALTFMTYIMHMHNRHPNKMFISRATGSIWGSELHPSMAGGKPYFHNPEPVPFRLTPNLQKFMGPIHTEGIFTIAIMAIARALTEPSEIELEQQLSLFVRDEMIYWFTSSHRAGNMAEGQLREAVMQNCELVVKRAMSLCKSPQGALPAHQTVIDLVARAVNPVTLASCEALWMGYL